MSQLISLVGLLHTLVDFLMDSGVDHLLSLLVFLDGLGKLVELFLSLFVINSQPLSLTVSGIHCNNGLKLVLLK